jgi:hypothetical protein
MDPVGTIPCFKEREQVFPSGWDKKSVMFKSNMFVTMQ